MKKRAQICKRLRQSRSAIFEFMRNGFFLFECFMLCACSFILKGKEHSVEGYIYVTSCLGITAGQCNKVLGFCHNGYGDTPIFC